MCLPNTPDVTAPNFAIIRYVGCYTEATNIRALTAGTIIDYDAMTTEKCAAACTGFIFFGIEYGGECKDCALLNHP